MDMPKASYYRCLECGQVKKPTMMLSTDEGVFCAHDDVWYVSVNPDTNEQHSEMIPVQVTPMTPEMPETGPKTKRANRALDSEKGGQA